MINTSTKYVARMPWKILSWIFVGILLFVVGVLFLIANIAQPHVVATIHPPSMSGHGIQTSIDLGDGISRYEMEDGTVCYTYNARISCVNGTEK